MSHLLSRVVLALLILASCGRAWAVGPRCFQMDQFAQNNATDCPTQTINSEWTIATGKTPTLSNFGVSFTESDTNPSCAVGDFKIYADDSDNKLKKCEEGVVSDLDTGGAGSDWDSIASPNGNQSLTMGNFTTTWTFGTATGAGVNMVSIVDGTSNTGTGTVLSISTASGSAATPILITAQGLTNGVSMSTAGLLAPTGTGGIQASDVVCTTCVGTSDIAANSVDGTKIALTSQANGDIMYYDGTDWVRLAAGTGFLKAGTPPTYATIGATDIGAGDLANVLVWQHACTADPCTLPSIPRDSAGADATVIAVWRGLVQRAVATCAGDPNSFTIAGTSVDLCDGTGINTGADALYVTYEL